MDHVDCVGGILFHRHQLESAPDLTQRFLFPAEPGINQGKDANCGTKLCLFLHNFFLFEASRPEQEKIVQEQAEFGPAVCILALIDAGLGRKEEALREIRRALELVPMEKDSTNAI